MAELNGQRAAGGEEPIDYGIARHAGEVMYGNIGTRDRLDFTVIGPAVNLASRMEKLCRVPGPKVLISDTFAGMCTGAAFRPLGEHVLQGVGRAVEVFTVDPPA
jgi:adenylate cyclase